MYFSPKDFPFFSLAGHNKVYLDSAATTQKPQVVLDALINFYTMNNANVGRGIYDLGERATTEYEAAREKVARYIGARDAREIIFTRNTTESINCAAFSWALNHCNSGDEIVVSELEHHANLLPWQRVAHESGAQLRYLPILPDGTLDEASIATTIGAKTKLVAIAHVSNALGTHLPIEAIIKQAHAVGAKVLIDAAQSAGHQPLDVAKLGCDFLAFSGHKMLGPTGIGVLYAKKELLDQMVPYNLGGGMVREVTWQGATWLSAPQKFEAGTPAIAEAVSLGVAIDYLRERANLDELGAYEGGLCAQLIAGLDSLPRVTILGPREQLAQKGHLVSFIVDGIHAHDVAAYLNSHGIAVRAGHHCAQPLARKLGYEASVRASFYGYNSSEDVDLLLKSLKKLLFW